ncbi:hypothetical protein LAUMK191_04101 [Mycobacterium attenuatum]|nr:hypothetical protein LAUMK191_04101 [Mycobacterium attenuatum]
MFDLSRPEAIRSIAAHGRVWHVEPGTVEVNGDVLRFVLSGCGQFMQVHLDAMETVLSDGSGAASQL